MKQWIIAIAVAIVYLAVSFITQGWAYTWLIWIGYAVYRFMDDRKGSKD